MADFVTEQMTIDATAEEIMAVLLDFPRYPQWARDLKSVEVLSTDAQGRGREVRFRAAAMGRSTHYTLYYDHEEPGRLAWKLTNGDYTRKLDGFYALRPAADGRTIVNYQLEVELIVPLPGFVKRRSQSKIMHTALRELKARVEATNA
jgi:uncharacterized membrane protein